MKKIAILGGGVGGVTAAAQLGKRVGAEAEVTLVDKEAKHYFPPSYPWLVMGWREPDELWRPLNDLKARKVKLHQGEVLSIEPEERRVKTTSGDLSYDHMLVALGAQLDSGAIEGYQAAANHPYDLEGAVGLGQALRSFREGKVAVGISSLPFKCPAAPYETALLMDFYFRQLGIRSGIEMEFFTPEPHPLPAAGTAIGKQVGIMLEQRNIELHTKRQMEHVDPNAKRVQFRGGSSMEYDLLVAVPPHTTCEAVRRSDLTKDSPWIQVDRYTMRSAYDDVYAIGDVTSIQTPSGNVPFLPKAGVFAEAQAEVASENIVADIAGGEGTVWNGHGMCFLETGYGRAGMVRGSFYGEGDSPISMRKPSRLWHWVKVLVEKRWMGRFFGWV